MTSYVKDCVTGLKPTERCLLQMWLYLSVTSLTNCRYRILHGLHGNLWFHLIFEVNAQFVRYFRIERLRFATKGLFDSLLPQQALYFVSHEVSKLFCLVWIQFCLCSFNLFLSSLASKLARLRGIWIQFASQIGVNNFAANRSVYGTMRNGFFYWRQTTKTNYSCLQTGECLSFHQPLPPR